MTKPRKYRQWLREGRAKGDLLAVCDCWDVLFQTHPDEISNRFPEFNADIAFNAEINCFPRGDLAHLFPDSGSPWRYMNCGFMVGAPASILTFLEAMNLDTIPDDHQLSDGSWVNPNDQEFFTLTFLEQPVRSVLDTKAVIANTLHGGKIEDYDLTGPKIRIKATGIDPIALHGNGSGKYLMPAMIRKILT